jgi:hypothetical protein
MHAVWSFWSKPFRTRHEQVWLTPAHHLFAWVLSVETAQRHYTTTTLVTDDWGVALLVDRLGLRFTSVSTELEALRDADPDWWVLGKLWTYRAQTQPFVHIDNDVFMWKRLPAHVEDAAVFAQNPESFPTAAESWYRPAAYARAIRSVDGWAPEEWWWSASRELNQAVCCGIVGGTAPAFLSYYADLAIRMIEHPRNRDAWACLGSPVGDNILFEQYLLAACVAFHQQRPASAYRDITIDYLFESTDAAFDEAIAARAGYTHLIGAAKSNRALATRLAARVRRDYPAFYDRCLENGSGR